MALSSFVRNGLSCLQTKLRVESSSYMSLVLSNVPVVQNQQCRSINKHRIPKWKQKRREKYMKIPLPAFEDIRRLMQGDMTPAEIRAFMRQRGTIPYVKGSPTVCYTDSGAVIEEYVPKEGTGVADGLSAKDRLKSAALSRISKFRGKREVKKAEEDFNVDAFAEEALELHKEVHTLLTKVFPRNFMSEYRDEEDFYRLHDLVTEFAWPTLTNGLDDKTLVWKYVESLEPPKVVMYGHRDVFKKGNTFGQITVRFHSKQIMAIYDRFGRLMYGSETVPKDTVDFIVFEKHLSDTLGKWRLHSKLRPSWQASDSTPRRTVLVPGDNSGTVAAEAT